MCGCRRPVGVSRSEWLPPDPTESTVRGPAGWHGLSPGRADCRSGAQRPGRSGRLYWLTRSLHPREVAAGLPGTTTTWRCHRLLRRFRRVRGPLPLYLSRTLGYESGLVFALYLGSSVGSALWYDRAGALAERYSPSGLQVGGLLARAALHPAVAAVGLLLPATLVGTAVNGVVFALIGVAWAVIAVTAASVVTQLAPPAIRGEALGLYTAISGLASGVGSILGGGSGATTSCSRSASPARWCWSARC